MRRGWESVTGGEVSCLPGPPASRRRPQASLASGPGALGGAPRVDAAASRRVLPSLGAPASVSGKFSWGAEGAAPRGLEHAAVPWVYFLFFKKTEFRVNQEVLPGAPGSAADLP